jgi:hypothetical protein
MVLKLPATISCTLEKPRVIPFSVTSSSDDSAAFSTSSASSLWSAARVIEAEQMLINCRSSDLSLTMRTYSSIDSRRGRPSVSEASHATPPTDSISLRRASSSLSVTMSTTWLWSMSSPMRAKTRWCAISAKSSERSELAASLYA